MTTQSLGGHRWGSSRQVWASVPNVVASIDFAAVLKKLGEKTFLEIAKVNIGDLETYLSGEELEKILTRERKGTRKLKWIPK